MHSVCGDTVVLTGRGLFIDNQAKVDVIPLSVKRLSSVMAANWLFYNMA